MCVCISKQKDNKLDIDIVIFKFASQIDFLFHSCKLKV